MILTAHAVVAFLFKRTFPAGCRKDRSRVYLAFLVDCLMRMADLLSNLSDRTGARPRQQHKDVVN